MPITFLEFQVAGRLRARARKKRDFLHNAAEIAQTGRDKKCSSRREESIDGVILSVPGPRSIWTIVRSLWIGGPLPPILLLTARSGAT